MGFLTGRYTIKRWKRVWAGRVEIAGEWGEGRRARPVPPELTACWLTPSFN